MRVSLEWLGEWVDWDGDAASLAESLTLLGLEVDAVEAVAPSMEGVVVASVERVRKHPRADRLSVCRVDDGTDIREVVCGAPNVAEGIRVPYAAVGTRLADGRQIDPVEFRGVTSSGMLCSASELGLSDDAAGLMLLAPEAPVGQPLSLHLKLDDTVLDLDLTPNRGDCFSIIGVARELAAKLDGALMGPVPRRVEPATGGRLTASLDAPEGCPRFVTRIVRGLRNDVESPVWLRERLRRSGVRAIHPVVDVTNYVMLELGQPLHAYDLSRVEEPICARWAEQGEALTLLDGQRLELDADVLVIADGEWALGLAGVMGGQGSAVTGSTRDVLFEAAFFAPAAIAGRPRRYGLHTDASVRFERGVDPAGQERAIERATELLLEIAGGEAGPTTVSEAVEEVPRRQPIELRQSKLESLLGMSAQASDVQRLLERLSMQVSATDGGWSVTPPSFRFDINIEEDLIEEVGRVIGYDAIPARPGEFSSVLGSATESRISEEALRDALTHRGYDEAVTYGFIAEDLDEAVSPEGVAIRVANPISIEQSVMRRSLWPGLLNTARRNLSRQVSGLRIFEVGPQFEAAGGGSNGGSEPRETPVVAGLAAGPRLPECWDEPARGIDFFDVKSDVEALLDLTHASESFEFEKAVHPALNPSQSARILRNGTGVGWLGALHPSLQAKLEFRESVYLFALRLPETFESKAPKFASLSKYPQVRRDLALLVDEDVSSAAIVREAEEAIGSLLREVIVFDVYRGQGIDASRKSIAIGLILQDASRTLTDGDADQAVHSVTQHLERKLGATIRS